MYRNQKHRELLLLDEAQKLSSLEKEGTQTQLLWKIITLRTLYNQTIPRQKNINHPIFFDSLKFFLVRLCLEYK